MTMRHPHAAAMLALALGLAACTSFPAANQAPTIEIAQGQLVGVQQGGLQIYRGIPYAAPPVGERRWRPPGQASRWEGPRDAKEFGASCIQPALPPQNLYFDRLAKTSEDCLTLNIWAPGNASNAPVILWIHGGSLRIGGSEVPMYDGSNFARRGVVFVSANYRLGALGWLAHPELSTESPRGISGNYGLLDQIAALRWIQANIAEFGGDPANVTIMGESAGALSASYLLVSPLARGLFGKAIIQSTNSRAFPELSRPAYGLPPAEETGRRTLSAIGASDLAKARAMDAQRLTDAVTIAGFSPQGTIDGHVLPMQIIDAFDRGLQAKVPVLAGINSGEIRAQRALLPRTPATEEAYLETVAAELGELAPAFLELYPYESIEQARLDMTRDGVYGWATERIVRDQTAAGMPAFFYLFDHCYPAARERDLCAFHAGELPFVFGWLDTQFLPPNWPVPSSLGNAALSDTMMDYWVSFADTGIPVSDTGPVWHRFGASQAYMRFDLAPHAEFDPLPGSFELHENLVQQRKRAGEQWFFSLGLPNSGTNPPTGDADRVGASSCSPVLQPQQPLR